MADYLYPEGRVWSQLFTEGRYRDPSLAEKQLPMINGTGRVKKPPMFEGADLDLQQNISIETIHSTPGRTT